MYCVPGEKENFLFFSSRKKSVPSQLLFFQERGEGAKVSKMPPAVSLLPFFSWNEIPPSLQKCLQVIC